MVVHQEEPVVEVVDEREGVRDVVSLGAEHQQHSQAQLLLTTGYNVVYGQGNWLKLICSRHHAMNQPQRSFVREFTECPPTPWLHRL